VWRGHRRFVVSRHYSVVRNRLVERARAEIVTVYRFVRGFATRSRSEGTRALRCLTAPEPNGEIGRSINGPRGRPPRVDFLRRHHVRKSKTPRIRRRARRTGALPCLPTRFAFVACVRRGIRYSVYYAWWENTPSVRMFIPDAIGPSYSDRRAFSRLALVRRARGGYYLSRSKINNV